MPRIRSRCRAAALLAAAASLVLAGCTAEKKDAAGTSPSGGPGAPVVDAVAPGVTADSIKVGIAYPDLTAVKQFMKIDHGDYEATYKALIDKINASGGINGRKIVPVFGKINVASPAAAQETCVKLTEDEKVFAVIGTLNASEPLCYVQTHKTAVVGGQQPAKNYAPAQAPWFAYERGGDEVGEALGEFAAANAFVGRKVAVIGSVLEESLTREVVLPALQKLGVTPVETAVLDANAGDAAAMTQQQSVFIQKFQASGADTVVVVGGMAGSFPQQLEKTGFRPRLLFTSVNSAGLYTSDATKHDFSTVTDALALGARTAWAEPMQQECVRTVEAAIPELKGTLSVDPKTLPSGVPVPQNSLGVACQTLAVFKAIAEKAGPDLNYRTFQEAGFTVGRITVPGILDQADYTKDTPHGAIPARLWKYSPESKKFVLAQ